MGAVGCGYGGWRLHWPDDAEDDEDDNENDAQRVHAISTRRLATGAGIHVGYGGVRGVVMGMRALSRQGWQLAGGDHVGDIRS